MEAKRRDLFSSAEKQLLTLLAILRELRLRAGKRNVVTQGFYTDEYRYCFMATNSDGMVEISVLYDVMSAEGGEDSLKFYRHYCWGYNIQHCSGAMNTLNGLIL